MTKVLLTFPDASIYTQVFPVTGRSGKLYGHSVWNSLYGMHAFEMTSEAYEKAADDILRNGKKPGCYCVPRFIEVPTGVSAAEITPTALQQLQGEGLTKELDNSEEFSRIADLVTQSEGLVIADQARIRELQGMTKTELREILPPECHYTTKARMIVAILEHEQRTEKPAQSQP